MATLLRQGPEHDDLYETDDHRLLSENIPQPFPSAAEREQEEVLASLAAEELRLDDGELSNSALGRPVVVREGENGASSTYARLVANEDRYVSCKSCLRRLKRRMNAQPYRRNCYLPSGTSKQLVSPL